MKKPKKHYENIVHVLFCVLAFICFVAILDNAAKHVELVSLLLIGLIILIGYSMQAESDEIVYYQPDLNEEVQEPLNITNDNEKGKTSDGDYFIKVPEPIPPKTPQLSASEKKEIPEKAKKENRVATTIYYDLGVSNN